MGGNSFGGRRNKKRTQDQLPAWKIEEQKGRDREKEKKRGEQRKMWRRRAGL